MNNKSQLVSTKAILGAVIVAFICSAQFTKPAAAAGKVCRLDAQVSLPQRRSRHIDYSIDAKNESFYVWAPPAYNGSENFGLIVYVSSMDQSAALPPGWESVLTTRKFLFVSPQGAGNGCRQSRRCGLALFAALEMQRYYKIDARRVFAAGVSGGARTASDLGFCQADVFRGTIQDCGSNFYRKVAMKESNNWVDSNGNPYGVVETSPYEVQQAKATTRFCLITGSGDFRRGNVRDIYNDGFAREGFMAHLLDISGMGHQDCDAATLEKALDFLTK